MARARTYRHDLRSSSNWTPKDGHSRGKQTYRCRDCHYRFTPTGNRRYYPQSVKEGPGHVRRRFQPGGHQPRYGNPAGDRLFLGQKKPSSPGS